MTEEEFEDAVTELMLNSGLSTSRVVHAVTLCAGIMLSEQKDLNLMSRLAIAASASEVLLSLAKELRPEEREEREDFLAEQGRLNR